VTSLEFFVYRSRVSGKKLSIHGCDPGKSLKKQKSLEIGEGKGQEEEEAIALKAGKNRITKNIIF
jgi:hypothetical protein